MNLAKRLQLIKPSPTLMVTVQVAALRRQGIEVIESSMRRHAGKFVTVTDELLTLKENGSDIWLKREDVARVSTSSGPKRGEHALIGLLVGGAIGVGIGAASGSKRDGRRHPWGRRRRCRRSRLPTCCALRFATAPTASSSGRYAGRKRSTCCRPSTRVISAA